jgi:hypothetical protein
MIVPTSYSGQTSKQDSVHVIDNTVIQKVRKFTCQLPRTSRID